MEQFTDEELNYKYNIAIQKRAEYWTAEDYLIKELYLRRAGEEAKKELDNENGKETSNV